MSIEIYGLRNVGSKEVRYVGQSKHGGAYRLRHACYLAKWQVKWRERDGEPVPLRAAWFMGADGPVEAFVIDTCETEADARRREREVIVLCLALGHRLFNGVHVPMDRRIPWNATRNDVSSTDSMGAKAA